MLIVVSDSRYPRRAAAGNRGHYSTNSGFHSMRWYESVWTTAGLTILYDMEHDVPRDIGGFKPNP